eukprot:9496948-Ditylum_brightwellii.AAC.1
MEEVITMVDLLYTPVSSGGLTSSLVILSIVMANLPHLLPMAPERLQFDKVLTQDLPEKVVDGKSLSFLLSLD